MNLLDAKVELRLRTLPEVLDLAFLFCARHLWLYMRLATWALLPSFLVCVAARWALHLSWVYVWLMALGLGGVAQGAYTLAAGRLLFEDTLKARSLIAPFVQRLPSYLVGLLASRFIIAGGATVFLLLLPSAAVRVLFIHETVLLEGVGGVRRSASFVKRQGVVVSGLAVSIVLAWFFGPVVGDLLGEVVVNLILQAGEPFGSLWSDGGSLFALAGFFAVLPWIATARFLVYTSIRTRKEGWDIQLKFMAIAAENAQ